MGQQDMWRSGKRRAVRLNVNVAEWVHEALRAEAAERGETVQDVVRRVLTSYVQVEK